MATERTRDDPSRTALWTVGLLLLAAVLWQLRGILVLVAFALLLAYVLDPLVRALERMPLGRGRRLQRPLAVAVVILALVASLVWAFSLIVPRLVAELEGFLRSVPRGVETLLAGARAFADGHGLGGLFDPVLANARANASAIVQWLGGAAARWAGRLFGNLIQVLGLLALPLLTFYLLAERTAVRDSVMRFVPAAAHEQVASVRNAVNLALRSYVRGQGLVCLVMGAATGMVLAVIGYPVALLLGVIVAVAEVLPYLGFAVAALSIGIAGSPQGLPRVLIGIGVYALVNWIVGLLITPRVMGQHLKMHPFVVMVSILAGGELLGPAGAILALPGAAIVQSLIAELAPKRAAGARPG